MDRRRTAWALIALALAVRVVVVLAVHWPRPIFDPADYDRHAVSLAAGHGYPGSLISGPGDPTALRMPGYPAFLAVVYKVAGHHFQAARLAQALLGTVAVALIGLIALRVFGRRVALIALGIAALFPPLVVLAGVLMSENLLIPLELAAVAAVLEHRRSAHRYRWAIAAGALSALALLTRPNALALVVALTVGVLVARPGVRRPAVAYLVAVAIVWAPWPVRNASALHALVPLSDELGLVATGIYNDYAAHRTGEHPGRWVQPWKYPNASRPIWTHKELTEPQMDRRLRAAAWRYVRGHPGYVVEAGFWNSLRLLHVESGYPTWARNLIGLPRGAAVAALYGFFAVLALALAGALAGGLRRAPPWLWLVPVLMWLSVVFLSSEPRSRSPVDPFIVLLAAYGAGAIAARVRRRDRAAALSSRPA